MGSKATTVRLPPDLAVELRRRIAAGEFRSASGAVETAVRYYLERHSDEDWAEYVRQEIESGLHGTA